MSDGAALGTVLALMTRPLGAVFGGPTWATWRAVLRAAFALDLTPDERAVVEELTGRQVLPTAPVRELWLLLGRRSGKSIIAALIAVWATTCRTYTLAPGEVGVFTIVAADRRQSRVIKRYISGLLNAVPSLRALVLRETREAIWLTNGLCIEIHTCSYRSLRGYTVVGAAVDEVSFWSDEESANPDTEVLIALRAAMASVPEAMLVGLTTTYAKRGEVGRIYDKHFGNDESAAVLVVKGPTLTMNPTIDRGVIDAAYEDDPIAAAAEYGAEFRRDVESYIDPDTLKAAVVPGRSALPYVQAASYFAAFDSAGGAGKDSSAGAIAHCEGERERVVLDALFERRPPFSPDQAIVEFAGLCRQYSIGKVIGDRFAGLFPAEAFQRAGLTYEPSAKPKSDLYRDALPLLTSQRAELLDDPRLISQLLNLERRTARGGRDTIDHKPRAHDDLANAAAIVLTVAALTPQDRATFLPTTGLGYGTAHARVVRGGAEPPRPPSGREWAQIV